MKQDDLDKPTQPQQPPPQVPPPSEPEPDSDAEGDVPSPGKKP